MYNDPALSAQLVALFQQKLGKESIVEDDPKMGSEDFGVFGLKHKIPAVIFWLGAYDPAKVAESKASGSRCLRRTLLCLRRCRSRRFAWA